jgi:hypothetical protein
MIGRTRRPIPALFSAQEGGNPMLYFPHPCPLGMISLVCGVGHGR